ncbi:hypothetical protein PSEMO_42790 [Pseudomonas putida]|uniref:Lactate dehydrogenase n=2 Tax=Pseudomonas putida TaxID=303 RepID=A0A1Q9R0G1_PSEPU|nr:hypothetical protein PSEMO_42790 [Pseudomonas putida]
MDITGPKMNPISAGLRITPVYTAPQNTTTPSASSVQVPAVVSTSNVTLGQTRNDSDGYTYSSRSSSASASYALEQDSVDKLSVSLLTGIQGSSNSERFQGVGAALIEQLALKGGQSVSQSVFRYAEGTEPSAAALKLRGESLRQAPANAISLSLTTASGATITLSLASDEHGLAVSAEVEGGELNAYELKGLADLADGFQAAIDGLAKEPPSLKLDGLVKFDSNLFSSLKMNASLQTASGEPQVFDLSLDDKARNLSLQGPSGNFKLDLDTHDSSLLGSSGQRQAAIGNYLEQFDAARKRGNGDKDLMNLFKEAFVQLNSVDDAKQAESAGPISGKTDRLLLSGLADFKASIGQTAKSVNPLLPTETDRFDYSVSQSTTAQGKALSSRSIQQDQQSKLSAAWHVGANPQVPLALGTDYKSQNYRYHEVTDEAKSSTRLGFNKDNRLVEASATQQASQNERVRSYVDGVLTSETNTPKSTSQTRNLLGLLTDVLQRERVSMRDKGVSVLESQLADKRNQWWLQGETNAIRA